MIHELEKAGYESVRTLYREWRFNNRVNSLIEGYNPGKIYVENIETPHTAIAWVKDMFYLAGDETNQDFNEALDDWIIKVIFPQAQRVGLTYFAVQGYPLEKWESIIKNVLQHRDLRINNEWKYTFNQEKFTKIQWKDIPTGISIDRIDEKLLADPHGAVILNRQIIPSCGLVSRFTKDGVGFCVRRGKTIISSCYSVYVTGKVHEIGIDTFDPAHRNCGFAALAARAYIDYCNAHGLTPLWTADEINAPSNALARKLGFEKVGEHPDYYIVF